MNLPLLTELRLNNNRIESMMKLSQSYLPEVALINLSSNCISELPALSFRNVTSIDLSKNAISSVTCLSDFRTSRLQFFNLAHNRIRSVVPVMDMPNLQELNLEGNDVSDLLCLTEPQLVPMLAELSVKDNAKMSLVCKKECLGIDRVKVS